MNALLSVLRVILGVLGGLFFLGLVGMGFDLCNQALQAIT